MTKEVLELFSWCNPILSQNETTYPFKATVDSLLSSKTYTESC